MDDEGGALDVAVRRRRDKHAAREPVRELPREQNSAPTEITTGGLQS